MWDMCDVEMHVAGGREVEMLGLVAEKFLPEDFTMKTVQHEFVVFILLGDA